MADRVWVHWPARPIIRSWMLIQKWAFYFFGWRGVAGWVSSPLTSLANHQKLNVIQKWAFNFLAGEGWWIGFESIDQPGQSSEVEHEQSKNEHFIFFIGEGWQMGLESIDQPRQSSEVECNPKMSILFFWLERGGRWGSSPSTSPADHQKLNVIQKWAFYFFDWRGWQMGFESIDQPGRSSEVECNPKMSILFFWLERGGRWVWVHWPAWPIIRSWT